MSEQPTVIVQQRAPAPAELYTLVEELTYKPRWTVRLEYLDRGQGCAGLTLCIRIQTPDAYDPAHTRTVMHYMIVPAASYDRRSWTRWLFDQLLAVETLEAMEFFQLNGARPIAPNHGPGRDPYQIRELGTVEDAETSFRGERAAGSQPVPA
jgi:hypothetical protein